MFKVKRNSEPQNAHRIRDKENNFNLANLECLEEHPKTQRDQSNIVGDQVEKENDNIMLYRAAIRMKPDTLEKTVLEG